MAVQHGFIVLGDVSGYGEFIAKTELDHSREILAELLSTLCECAPGRLSVAQLEGDAVFWLCGEDAPDLVDLLEQKFVEYHRRLRFMTIATTCPCRACASVGALTLKFVVHSGSWVRQRVAGHDHFVGDDLVLAHRLRSHPPSSRMSRAVITSARSTPGVRSRLVRSAGLLASAGLADAADVPFSARGACL